MRRALPGMETYQRLMHCCMTYSIKLKGDHVGTFPTEEQLTAKSKDAVALLAALKEGSRTGCNIHALIGIKESQTLSGIRALKNVWSSGY